MSTLKVLERHPDRFRLVTMTGGKNRALLEEQVARWRPAYAGLAQADGKNGVATGPACLVEAATHPDVDVVVNAVVGAAGLDATLAALRAGKRVALANKETLVMAGELVAEAARQGGGELVPVDSEHSAVLQCLDGKDAKPARL
ncbi:MAG TPA: 1-deoxy-D-xylulose-5-phosphate reductoisomerase, partial [Gemmatimonadales bacterium]|nr:1-deoxy-D-xylulose-5-phosphate reductoisomerase [Gemmatimonadales bacterium]